MPIVELRQRLVIATGHPFQGGVIGRVRAGRARECAAQRSHIGFYAVHPIRNVESIAKSTNRKPAGPLCPSRLTLARSHDDSLDGPVQPDERNQQRRRLNDEPAIPRRSSRRDRSETTSEATAMTDS